MNKDNLNYFYEPKSIALIGASVKELSIGNIIIKNLVHYGFTGPIYPINPKVDEIRGIKAYPSIMDVPGEVELAHIVIPPPFVPEEVENCGKKGVKAIIINTAGFKEMGAEGQALEDDFLARAKKYGIRIIGPNCQGTINSDPKYNAYCNFTFTFYKPGSISIVAQSGGVGALIMQVLHDMEIGLRLYSSNGNGSDVSISEILKYYGEDEGTKVIILYLESLSNTKEFMEVAMEVAAKKPILAISAGRTEKGAAASKSHTGGLAGGVTMELIFQKAGILSFSNLEEICHAAIAFSSQPIPNGSNVGMITNTGGPAIIATDELVSCGMAMPPISEKAKAELKLTMLEQASINNPLDVVATAGAAHFKSAIEVMMNEEQIDGIYLTFVTPPFVDCVSVAKEIAEISKKQIKPIVCNYITDKQNWGETSKILADGGIPCFDYPETAAKALSSLSKYNEIRSRKKGSIKTFTDINKGKAKAVFDSVKAQGKEVLTAKDVYEILEAYKIPIAKWSIAKTVDEAVIEAEKIGFPLVIKADSEKIIHKSDVGGVAINIKNAEEVRTVVQNMQNKLQQPDLKFFIQEFLPESRELIIGVKEEEGLGHLIMFGMGGVMVEVYKDVVFKIAPTTDVEANEMLENIKSAALLNDFRGKKGIDKGKVSEILQRISTLVNDFPEIKELDLNPIFANENRVCAVDARIIM
ncbi:MAG: acetate--CoA ligase family protein [Bacteroidetes bacterium]|nr:acetate--CoA ligase family protein [Bacteroidota bacterium]